MADRPAAHDARIAAVAKLDPSALADVERAAAARFPAHRLPSVAATTPVADPGRVVIR